MATKTYVTHRLNLAVAWEKPTGVGDKTKHVTLAFSGGRFTTDDEATQAYIESLPTFNKNPDKGDITLEVAADLLAAAQIKAKALRDVANKAVAAADEAEAAAKALAPAPAAKAPAAA